MTALKTKTTQLPQSRVRIDVEVGGDELKKKLNTSANALARSMRMPGFRQGKVPPNLVIKRLGHETVMEQMLQDSLGEWCRRAILSSEIRPVGGPKVDLEDLPAEGEALGFSIEISVRPSAKLGNYSGLEVGKREPEVADQVIEEELVRLREIGARLEGVDRPIQNGDYAILDFDGTFDGQTLEGGSARDYTLEVGSNALVDGFEDQLVGLAAGETKKIEVTMPEQYQNTDVAGKDVEFEITVKAVQEKHLPELDDDLASEVSEFDTLEELKADIKDKLVHSQEHVIDDEYRIAVVDSAVKDATIELSDDLVSEQAHDMWHSMAERLQRQGIDPVDYLKMAEKDEKAMVEEFKPRAEASLKRESVLEAVALVEGLETSDEELVEALSEDEEVKVEDADKFLKQLKRSGQYQSIREQLLFRKATDLLVGRSIAISVDTARARKALWTPTSDEEREQASAGLWTPGS